MPDADPLAAALDEIRKRRGAAGRGAGFVADVPRLLAAVEDARNLATEWALETSRLDALAERRDTPASVLLSARAQACQDHASALSEAISRALLGDSP